MARNGNSGFIGKDMRTSPTGIIGQKKRYLERINGRLLATPPVVSAATLLLDETGLGSAAAAFSVRHLRAAYAGDAVRVRRSSDNAECDVEFLNGWISLDSPINNLSAGSGATLTAWAGSDSCYVVTWYDQSGNARNATQATAANQPKILNAGVLLTFGSRSRISFDGSNDVLHTSAFALNQPSTYSFAMQNDVWASDQYILIGIGDFNNLLRQNGSTPAMALYAGSSACSNSDLALSTSGLLTCIFNGASSVLQVNAGSDSTGNIGAGNSSGIAIGGNFGFYAEFSASELVVWSSALDATARTTQRANVNAAFSLY